MKHFQESEIEFRRDEAQAEASDQATYPVARGLIVHQYGGHLEECIAKARKEFKLGPEWVVVSSSTAHV